jgi:hypothetical protein
MTWLNSTLAPSERARSERGVDRETAAVVAAASAVAEAAADRIVIAAHAPKVSTPA